MSLLNEQTKEFFTHKIQGDLPSWEKQLVINFHAQTGVGKTELLQKISEVLKQKNQKFGLVLQDPYIYNDTIIRNIRVIDNN